MSKQKTINVDLKRENARKDEGQLTELTNAINGVKTLLNELKYVQRYGKTDPLWR